MSRPLSDDKGTRERDADIRDMRDREAEQHDLMTMIGIFLDLARCHPSF